MNPVAPAKDLIVLTADKMMKLGVEALLRRHTDLGISQLSFDVFPHPSNDPGVLGRAHEFLRPQLVRYRHAIAMCDRDGCGREPLSREEIESRIQQRLRTNGWENRATAIVLDPELEAWVWGDWQAVAAFIRWSGGGLDLRNWLIGEQFLRPDQTKPRNPKEALQSAMERVRMPFSGAIHQHLGQRGAFASCIDPAFLKLLATLRTWFPLP